MATLRIADSVGRVLGGRYRLTRPLGTGASAHVYVADDVTLRRRVAVKVLHPGLADDEAFLRRFQAEARFVAALRHPSILRVYDWGEDDGSAYLVTELLEGGSLRALLDRGRLLSASQAAAVGLGAAGALEHAHRRGLVHRDIKPANLLFDEEGRVCIADFGLARALAESTVTEPVGAIVGTARYAAPEQVQGRMLDPRADVYSLALVLVEATTGVVPFAADTMLATLMGRLAEPLHVPGDVGPLADVIEAAGTIDPADRIDAAGMVKALAALTRTLPPPAPLHLASPLSTGEVERDVNPTQMGSPQMRERTRGSPEPASVLLDRSVGANGPPSQDPARRPAAASAGLIAVPPPPETDHQRPVRPDRERLLHDDREQLPRQVITPPQHREPPPPHVPGAPHTARMVPSPPDRDANAGHGDDAPAGARGTATLSGSDPTRQEDTAAPLRGADAERPFPSPAPPDGDRVGSGGRSRHRWGRVIVVVVIVVLLAGGGAAGWLATHRPVPLVAVPALRGETAAQATATLAGHDLRLIVAGRRYDPTAPLGTVIAQAPLAGRLREHRSVEVTLSLGPRPVPIPVGLDRLTQAQATRRIRAAGLRVGRVSTRSSLTVASGHVLAYSPASGSLLPGGAVSLVVSSGKPSVTVPLLAGATAASYDAAATALRAAHLVPSEHLEYSTTVAKGSVIVTDPAPKVSVLYGSAVQVDVSEGPHLVEVPYVVGDSVAGADQVLTDDGFAVSGVVGNPSGAVTGTSPGYGQELLIGSSVQIVTG